MELKLDKLFCGFCNGRKAAVEKVSRENGCNIFAVKCPCGAIGAHTGYKLSDKSDEFNDAKAQNKASVIWQSVVGV